MSETWITRLGVGFGFEAMAVRVGRAAPEVEA